MSVQYCMQYPQGPEEGVRSLGAGVSDSCEPLCWELSLSPQGSTISPALELYLSHHFYMAWEPKMCFEKSETSWVSCQHLEVLNLGTLVPQPHDLLHPTSSHFSEVSAVWLRFTLFCRFVSFSKLGESLALLYIFFQPCILFFWKQNVTNARPFVIVLKESGTLFTILSLCPHDVQIEFSPSSVSPALFCHLDSPLSPYKVV